MTQYEQENDPGRRGGEVDAETHEKAWRDADERRGSRDAADELEREPEPGVETGERQQ